MKTLLEVLVKAEEVKLVEMKKALENLASVEEEKLEVFTGNTEASADEAVKDTLMPEPTPKEDKEAEETIADLAKLSTKELIALCESKGIKVLKKGRNKKYYFGKLAENEATEAKLESAEKGEEAEETKEEVKKEIAETADIDEEDWDLEEQEDVKNAYEGKSAKELFTLCKERGLEVKPRQTAEKYKNMLIEDDEKQSEEENADWNDSDNDDWEI